MLEWVLDDQPEQYLRVEHGQQGTRTISECRLEALQWVEHNLKWATKGRSRSQDENLRVQCRSHCRYAQGHVVHDLQGYRPCMSVNSLRGHTLSYSRAQRRCFGGILYAARGSQISSQITSTDTHKFLIFFIF